MRRADAVWLGVALGALGLGGLAAWWMVTPSRAVRAQLQIDLAMQHLARWAGDRGGVFPTATELPAAARGPGGDLPAQDPWGRPWRYERVGARGPVRLWSVGPDGVDQGGSDGDDLASWTR